MYDNKEDIYYGRTEKTGRRTGEQTITFLLDRRLFRLHVWREDRYGESCDSVNNTGNGVGGGE